MGPAIGMELVSPAAMLIASSALSLKIISYPVTAYSSSFTGFGMS